MKWYFISVVAIITLVSIGFTRPQPEAVQPINATMAVKPPTTAIDAANVEKVVSTPTPTPKPTQKPTQALTGNKYDLMRTAKINEADFIFVDFIVNKESGWAFNKWNKLGSGAYGLCQALPASKMASAGPDYMTNPITQLQWCDMYAIQRYGSWAKAYSFWLANNWW